ncbi:MAG TPA: type II toxin-antitoxin system RelE/ParE family toxin [Acetobacteraceae bacterium]|jgi:mRNA interferase RelE/StbE
MPRPDAKRLREKLGRIAADPSGSNPAAKPLVGQAGVFRVRQGDWRAVYVIEDGDLIVDRVGSRKEVYR